MQTGDGTSMKLRPRYWIRAGVLAVFVALLGFALYQTVIGNQSTVLRTGDPAPDFTLTTVDGDTISLSDYKGQGVLINFWATWCGPCRREMPAIERRYQTHQDNGLVVLAVNVGEPEVSARGFAHSHQLTFPILLDPDKEVTKLYNVGQLPHSVFINPDGSVGNIVIGEMNDTIIEEQVLKILPHK